MGLRYRFAAGEGALLWGASVAGEDASHALKVRAWFAPHRAARCG